MIMEEEYQIDDMNFAKRIIVGAFERTVHKMSILGKVLRKLNSQKLKIQQV